MTKYSDQFVDWLVEEGYTHCFFVAGGNIMHLLDSVRTRMTCVPFVHEVGAAIAAEYHTATAGPGVGKAFVLVTAGPGLTNTTTAFASAWLESRELLVVGGQVKSTDLARGEVRQRGIQEVDGTTMVESVSKRVMRVERPVDRATIISAIREGATPRRGPVFIEMCLDAQAAPPVSGEHAAAPADALSEIPAVPSAGLDEALARIARSERPVLLIGQGASRDTVRGLSDALTDLGIPVMLTWNAADRLPDEHPLYAGRPNTWGQRSANVLIQQTDLLIAVGTRLGVQQTGFAFDGFVPIGDIIQIDIDAAELSKGHPHVELPLRGDADAFLASLTRHAAPQPAWTSWRAFVGDVRAQLPIEDPANVTGDGFVAPYAMLSQLCDIASDDDVIVPCSSGGAFTVTMQSLRLRANQRILTNKAVASMGYGLSGSIGAALANRDARTFLIEGDGGFAQNLQELGTVARTGINLKMLVFCNSGYASIRMTQRNYFNGAWIGCDIETGLGLPDWEMLAKTYGIPFARMSADDPFGGDAGELLSAPGPAFIEVPIDPEQTYFPKIMSAVQPDGSMRSNPLHLMHPELDASVADNVLKYINANRVNS